MLSMLPVLPIAIHKFSSVCSTGAFHWVEGFGLSNSGLSSEVLEWQDSRTMSGITASWPRNSKPRWNKTPGFAWWMMWRYLCFTNNNLLITSEFLIQLGLVCFRLFGSSQLNQKLLTTINASGKLHMVPANVNDYFVIRFCVCAQNATSEDIGTLLKIFF